MAHMPTETMIDIAKREAKKVAEYLHKNYPDQEVTKNAIRTTFEIPHNRSYLVFSLIEQYNIEVTRGALRPISVSAFDSLASSVPKPTGAA